MSHDIFELMHPRLQKECKRLFLNDFFPQAVAEAFKHVELELKERVASKKLYGVKLIRASFSGKMGWRLVVPLGEKANGFARNYLASAFKYYRNHAVHDGQGISKDACTRALIVATDLLNLLGAASIHFESLKDLVVLAKGRGFDSGFSVQQLLRFLEREVVIDCCVDGMFEEKAKCGWGTKQYEFVFETGLVEYEDTPAETVEGDSFHAEEVGRFKLTMLGEKVCAGELM